MTATKSTKSMLGVIGGGNMGSALVRGLLTSGFPSEQIVIVEKDSARVSALKREFADIKISPNLPKCDSVVLAVKPTDIATVCSDLNQTEVRQILSIVAGVKIASIEKSISRKVAVIRAMPNTPALIGQGASAMAASSTCDAKNISWAKNILLGVGTVVEVGEDLLDAVTGLSGSGPAYVFLLAEAMIDAGVRHLRNVCSGLPNGSEQLGKRARHIRNAHLQHEESARGGESGEQSPPACVRLATEALQAG